jgi:hypothetical protein
MLSLRLGLVHLAAPVVEAILADPNLVCLVEPDIIGIPAVIKHSHHVGSLALFGGEVLIKLTDALGR